MTEKICKKCGILKSTEEFSPYYGEPRKVGITRNICKSCKSKNNLERLKNNESRKLKNKEYLKDYHKRNNHLGKLKAYRAVDKRKGRDSITLEEFMKLLNSNPECYYCGLKLRDQLGLDRKDNSKGHCLDNVVICCEKCNHLLTDIPYEAKVLLSDGLKKITEKNLLEDWVIKTKRRKEKNGNKL